MQQKLNDLFKKVLNQNKPQIDLIKPIKIINGECVFNYPLIFDDKITYGGHYGNAFALKDYNNIINEFWLRSEETLSRYKLEGEFFKNKSDDEIKVYFKYLIEDIHNKFYKKLNPNNERIFGTQFGFEIPGNKDLFIRPIVNCKDGKFEETGDYEVRIYSDMLPLSQVLIKYY